ncbi:MAG: YHYH domain-containing protein [Rhodothermales bacterium]
MRRLIAVLSLVVFLFPLLASNQGQAHPGETDEKGCHFDSSGRYHCH